MIGATTALGPAGGGLRSNVPAATYMADFRQRLFARGGQWDDAAAVYSLARPSSATALWSQSGGLDSIQSVAAHVARTGQGGILLEASSTNVLQHSANIGASGWSKLRCNVGVPAGGGPAQTIIATEDSSNGMAVLQSVDVPAASRVTMSVFLRQGSTPYALVTMIDGSSAARQWFNLATASVASDNAAGSDVSKQGASIVALADGWMRVSFTVQATGTNLRVALYPAVPADLAYACTANTSQGYLWGAQIELGDQSSYIPTGSVIATRAADVLTLTPGAGTYDVTATRVGGPPITLSSQAVGASGWDATPIIAAAGGALTLERIEMAAV